MRHTHSWCAGAPFVCGSFLVFIALIVGLFIRQGEVHQSEAGSRLQDPLLGDSPPVLMQVRKPSHATSAELMDVQRPVACMITYRGWLKRLGHVGKSDLADLR